MIGQAKPASVIARLESSAIKVVFPVALFDLGFGGSSRSERFYTTAATEIGLTIRIIRGSKLTGGTSILRHEGAVPTKRRYGKCDVLCRSASFRANHAPLVQS
jgi:hypothetical protein